jgi:hypothetical protein
MLAGLMALVALCALPGVASADVFVTTTDDHTDQTGCTAADCTLREAMNVALTSKDVIHVPAGTYTLTLGAITLPNGTLQGAGAGTTVIRRDPSSPDSRVITIGTGAITTISSVTISGGRLSTGLGGGGVYVPPTGTLTIVNSAVVGNTALEGGGIFTQGLGLTLIGSTVSANTATSAGVTAGGGISVDAGFPAGTTIPATLTNSTVSGNTASGGRATQGGGINTDGALRLENTTVAGNRVIGTGTLDGAGIYQGAGVGNGTTPTATVRNSIIAGNTGGACGGDPTVLGTWGGDHNIDDDGSCGFSALGDKPGVNPLLGPLAANGGPTLTRALSPSSPAVNAGSACTTATDQRGRGREGACDIGAFEFIHPRLTVVTKVVNDQGGTQGPGHFNVHVRRGADVAGSPAAGTASGRTYTLLPGTYAVSADADSRYTAVTSGACTAGGAVTLAESQTKTCVITETDNPPVVGRLVNAERARGTVKIKLPTGTHFRALVEGEQLPVGTVVDTRKGRITLYAAADKHGGIAKADFYGGIFKLGQTKGKRPITVLTLVEKLTGCKAKGQATTARKKKRKRRLWGDGRGRFRTKGRNSAATVLGTKWLVEDRCTSTLTKVARGRVEVRDFVNHKTVIVRKHHRYIARAN